MIIKPLKKAFQLSPGEKEVIQYSKTNLYINFSV